MHSSPRAIAYAGLSGLSRLRRIHSTTAWPDKEAAPPDKRTSAGGRLGGHGGPPEGALGALASADEKRRRTAGRAGRAS